MEDWGSMPQLFLSHFARPLAFRKRETVRICLLASTLLIGLGSAGDSAPAFRRFAAPVAPRPAATARPAAPSFARPPAAPGRPSAGPEQAGPGGSAAPLARGPNGAVPEHAGQ